MAMRDLIPRSRRRDLIPGFAEDDASPFRSLHRQIDRLFEDALRGFGGPAMLSSSMTNWPSLEVNESDDSVTVMAEIPGLAEKDVEVLLEDGVLTIRGERKSERQETDKGRQFSERYYGRFERRIAIGDDVDEDKVSASFANGILTVTLPKAPNAPARTKRIAVTAGKGEPRSGTR